MKKLPTSSELATNWRILLFLALFGMAVARSSVMSTGSAMIASVTQGPK
jgi:hypothetical protein